MPGLGEVGINRLELELRGGCGATSEKSS